MTSCADPRCDVRGHRQSPLSLEMDFEIGYSAKRYGSLRFTFRSSNQSISPEVPETYGRIFSLLQAWIETSGGWSYAWGCKVVEQRRRRPLERGRRGFCGSKGPREGDGHDFSRKECSDDLDGVCDYEVDGVRTGVSPQMRYGY
jgi:hypothetical protein